MTFPGLRKLWLAFFTAPLTPSDPYVELHPMMDLMLRQAQALLDPDYRDELGLINETAEAFRQALEARAEDNRISWEAGVTFYNQVVQRVPLPNLRVLENWPIPYRDDNRYCWAFDENLFLSQGIDYLPASQRQVRKYVTAMEMANEVDCELAGDDAQEIWVCATELFPYEDAGVSYNQMWGKEPVSEPYHYQEWDYHAQLYRPDWATVIERRQGRGDPERDGRDSDQAQADREPHPPSDRRHAAPGDRAPARLRGRRGAGSQRRGAGHDRHPPRRDAGPAHQHPHYPPRA